MNHSHKLSRWHIVSGIGQMQVVVHVSKLRWELSCNVRVGRAGSRDKASGHWEERVGREKVGGGREGRRRGGRVGNLGLDNAGLPAKWWLPWKCFGMYTPMHSAT